MWFGLLVCTAAQRFYLPSTGLAPVNQAPAWTASELQPMAQTGLRGSVPVQIVSAPKSAGGVPSWMLLAGLTAGAASVATLYMRGRGYGGYGGYGSSFGDSLYHSGGALGYSGGGYGMGYGPYQGSYRGSYGGYGNGSMYGGGYGIGFRSSSEYGSVASHRSRSAAPYLSRFDDYDGYGRSYGRRGYGGYGDYGIDSQMGGVGSVASQTRQPGGYHDEYYGSGYGGYGMAGGYGMGYGMGGGYGGYGMGGGYGGYGGYGMGYGGRGGYGSGPYMNYGGARALSGAY